MPAMQSVIADFVAIAIMARDTVRRAAHVLWICRVSTASTLIGCLMLVSLDQVQDLFVDTDVGIGFWALFLVVLSMIWAFSVHYSARRILRYEHWGLRPDDPAREERRRIIQRDYQFLAHWIPRLFPLAIFACVVIAIQSAESNMRETADITGAVQRLQALRFAVMATGAVFGLFVLMRERLAARIIGVPYEAEPAVLTTPVISGLLEHFRKAPAHRARLFSRRFVLNWAALLLLIANIAFILLAATRPFWLAHGFSRAVMFALIMGIWVMPLTIVAALSHRLRIPLMLIAFLALALAASLARGVHDVRSFAFGRPPVESDRSIVEALSAPAVRPTLKTALGHWLEANCPEARVGDWFDVERCPRPIILTGQGGASRAAFAVAETFGVLLDRTRAPGAPYRDAGSQVFAMSTVSGATLGAVIIRAALEDADRIDAVRIRQEERRTWLPGTFPMPGSAWRRSPCITDPASGQDAGWQSCLGRLAAGDFLSPVFVGMLFRDILTAPRFGSGRPLGGDRTTLLETAWERHYGALLGLDTGCGGASAGTGLGCRTLMQPRTDPARWYPLLIANGTSVETGRRLLTTPLLPHGEAEGGQRPPRTFPQTLDAICLLDSAGRDNRRSAQPDAACDQIARSDMRLSTVASMSARFPIISTAGSLRDGADNIVDRVVDGGYFENDGMATAGELVQALARIEPKLQPLILHVRNEPTTADLIGDGVIGPDAPDSEFLTWLLTPLQALSRTRNGRGHESAANAIALALDVVTANGVGCLPLGESRPREGVRCINEYVGIEVRNELCEQDQRIVQGPCSRRMPRVSMSWWLSKPVRQYISDQIVFHYKNREDFNVVLLALQKGCTNGHPAGCLAPVTP